MSVRMVLHLDPNDLVSDFDDATIARGVNYANQARVRDVSWEDDSTLVGDCVGSRGLVYEVEVGFELCGPSGRDLAIEWAACTCPVHAYCKHAVALILTAATSAPEVARPADPEGWRKIFTSVLHEVATQDPGTGAAIGLEFALRPPTRYQPGDTLVLRPVTIGKRGTWIKSGLPWSRLLYNTHHGDFNRYQYLALQALASDLRRSGVAFREDVPIDGAEPTVWKRLTDVADAGVALVAAQSGGLRAVELSKNASLCLDFGADGAGGAAMSVALLVDGERCGPVGVGLIGRPAAHGMYQVHDGVLRLAAFELVPGPVQLDLLTRNARVPIPVDHVAEFSASILPQLARTVSLEIEDGLFTPPCVTGPIPVLTIKLTDLGARAFWSTRYDVNDKHHDFDPDSQPALAGYRDGAAEAVAWQRVESALRAVAAASAGAPARVPLRRPVTLTAAEVAVLCGEVLPGLDCLDVLSIEIDDRAPAFRAASTAPQLEFRAGDGDTLRTDWFDLSIGVQVDGLSVPLAEIITELSSGATHMVLTNGVYFRLDTPELVRLRALIEEARALGEINGSKVNGKSLNVTLWDELLALGVVDKQVAQWRQNLVKLSTARPPVPVEVPSGLDATLRDYQRDGLDWLSFLWDNGLGGLLADDMGLGKTVQTLALIARAAAAGAGKFLVVAPTSVVSNWVAECHRFTPALTAVAISATEARSGGSLADLVAGADIVVTSYALVRIDFDVYAQIDWAGIILDEAQFVKNHNSKTHQCVRRLEAGFKLAITGTPMENNLLELWSLLSITVPGLFPSPKAFTDYFRKPIESGTNPDRLPVLRRRIKPVMLRRTKDQVAGELPAKQEQVLAVDLGARHRKLYDTRLARERQKVLGLLGDWEKNRFKIFRSLTLLRQLSLHAGLVEETELNTGSAKLDFLIEQLPQLVAEGHSALVFSQFTGFLAILRSHLDAIGLSYSYLDGKVSARGRAATIADFSNGTNQVFLISLKAGGFGLNLTEADYCFLCDPWWSPAAEAQAVDRTHRIGQTRPVTVYRLVSQGTIEEKVVALQERKRELFNAVIDDGELFSSAITASDVRDLLG